MLSYGFDLVCSYMIDMNVDENFATVKSNDNTHFGSRIVSRALLKPAFGRGEDKVFG